MDSRLVGSSIVEYGKQVEGGKEIRLASEQRVEPFNRWVSMENKERLAKLESR